MEVVLCPCGADEAIDLCGCGIVAADGERRRCNGQQFRAAVNKVHDGHAPGLGVGFGANQKQRKGRDADIETVDVAAHGEHPVKQSINLGRGPRQVAACALEINPSRDQEEVALQAQAGILCSGGIFHVDQRNIRTECFALCQRFVDFPFEVVEVLLMVASGREIGVELFLFGGLENKGQKINFVLEIVT